MQPTVQPNGIDARIGTGNWAAFNISLETIYAAADEWRARLTHVKKPWLCWNVSSNWSLVQQRLVKEFGWTPVVGFDPRSGAPPLEPGAILIDFNQHFRFPVMWPHFPLEFAHLFAPRLAFWHADLLCRLRVMEQLARLFESLENGEIAAVLDRGGRRNYLNFKSHRYWELCGCTTGSASENQFYNGTGWWRNFQVHPKCTLSAERKVRRAFSWDSGVGILYWQKKYNGSVKAIDIQLVKEGHCSEIMAKHYISTSGHQTALRNLPMEIDTNYSLERELRRLGLARFLK